MLNKAVLGFSLALFLFLMTCPIEGSQRLLVNDAKFDYGYVPQGAKVSHVYWLKVTGEDSLTIERVKPYCGCTRAPLSKREFAGGDSTDLEVTFNTKGYKGRVEKSVRIETSEGAPHKMLRLKAFVVPPGDSTYPIMMVPSKLDMSPTGGGIRDEMEFHISNVSDMDLELRVIDIPTDYVELTLPRTVGAGESVKGHLRVRKSAIKTSFEKSLTVEVSDEGGTRFTLPVKRALRSGGE